MIDLDEAFRRVMSELCARNVLLEADQQLPSIVSLLAGGPVRGSWWGHALGHEIFMTCERIADDPDVLRLKLVDGKVSYVHRKLWPSLYAIATAREAWQIAGVSEGAARLLEEVEVRGQARLDELDPLGPRKVSAQYARLLEARLLVVSDEVHTASGVHVKRLETWRCWAHRVGFVPDATPNVNEARQSVEDACARLGSSASLPWQGRRRRRT